MANLGKYKSIIVSIALFIILDASVLMLNFYISFEIAEDAAGVNLAGRQRMLSQRMVKSLMDIDFSSGDLEQQENAIQELTKTVSLFDRTLHAFDVGGVADAAGGGTVELKPVTSEPGRKAIESAKELWQPYKVYLDEVISAGVSYERESLLPVIIYAKENNIPLLTLMNNLTVDLENVASAKATRLRMIQTFGICLAIINFFIILFHFIGELKRGDQKLEVAREETRKIMDTVNEGLFLVDKDFVIASQRSRKVSSMFGKSDIAGGSFDSLLADLVSDKHMETSKRFINLLFREDIKSNLIHDLNPLREVEVNIAEESGGYATRYLSFDFARAYEDGRVKNILITVNDISEKKALEKALSSAKEQNEQQLEVLTSILHANPAVLKRFVNGCFEGFQRINMLLREPAKSESSLRKKLHDIFIEIHSFKGEAGALGLESFQDLAHQFEDGISAIREKDDIAGDDFFPLVVLLDKLIRHAETVRELSDKLVAFGRHDSDTSAANGVEEWQHLHDFTGVLAARANKKAVLVTSGLTEVAMTDSVKKLVGDISVQCIRNAIVHGIEPPDERKNNYKDEVGRIDIRLVETSVGIELSIKDDGRGLDYDAIRRQAIASGGWSEEQLESWDSKKLVSLIFEPGFSTVDEEHMDAGRGVGLDVIRDRLQEFRGKIRISSRRGASTHFIISIPSMLGGEGEEAA